MTVIQPNSVAGINSITVQSGNSLAVHKANGELIRTITSNSGVSTFSSISVGTAATTNSAGKSINIGVGASISQHDANTLSFGTNGDERLKIESNGDVTLTNTSSNPQLAIISAANGIGEIQFGDTADAVRGNILYRSGSAGDALCFNGYNNTERLRITSTGTVLKGLTTARVNFGNNTSGVEYGFQIEGTTGITAGLSIIRNSNDANDGGIVLGKTRATSTGGNTVVQAGDDLGNIAFAGSDGTSLQLGAEIFAEVQTGVGNDDLPTDLIFKTNGGSTSTAERLRITSTGEMGLGTATPPTGCFHIHLTETPELNLFSTQHAQNNTCKLNFGIGQSASVSGNTGARIEMNIPNAGGAMNGELKFHTNSGDSLSEAMRITTAGDLLVHATGLNNSAVAGQALQISGTTRPTLIIRGNASGSNVGEIQFADNSGSDDDNTGIRAGLIQYDHSNNNMNFRVAGTYTGLKISGTNGRLERNFTGGSGTDDDGMWFNNGGTTSGTFIRFWQTTAGANVVGSISHTTSNTSYNTSSDYRLKENAVSISDGITRLKTLKPYRFNFKTEPSKTVDGFFAHEAATVVPEAVTGTKDEVSTITDTSIGVAVGDPVHQGMDYGKITPLLTAALQEAIAKIEVLETKVAALEGG